MYDAEKRSADQAAEIKRLKKKINSNAVTILWKRKSENQSAEIKRLEDGLRDCVSEWMERGKYRYGQTGCPGCIFRARELLKERTGQ